MKYFVFTTIKLIWQFKLNLFLPKCLNWNSTYSSNNNICLQEPIHYAFLRYLLLVFRHSICDKFITFSTWRLITPSRTTHLSYLLQDYRKSSSSMHNTCVHLQHLYFCIPDYKTHTYGILLHFKLFNASEKDCWANPTDRLVTTFVNLSIRNLLVTEE